jgi:hypothetical protein
MVFLAARIKGIEIMEQPFDCIDPVAFHGQAA